MGIPLGQWNGSDATKELQAKLVELDAKNSKRTNHLLVLTWVLVVLTVAIVVLTVVLLART